MKKILIGIAITLGVFFLILLTAEWWVEIRLQTLLNRNEKLSYDIIFEDIDINPMFTGMSLEEVTIRPKDSLNTKGTNVYGQVANAEIKGVAWLDLLLGRKASLRSLSFVTPLFEIYTRSDSTKSAEKNEKGVGTSFQELFGDVLSRAELSEFHLENASISLFTIVEDTVQFGAVKKFNIEALELKTDSVILNHVIPFELGYLKASLEGLSIKLDEFSSLSVGKINYDSRKSQLSLKSSSLSYSEDYQVVSSSMGKQVDLISFDIGLLEINDLEAQSSFYGELDIEASSIVLDSLVMTDYRNKNLPRPPDAEKPMFKGMVDLIPFPMQVDSILITNSSIAYTELPEGKDLSGTLRFGDINGVIRNITTYPLVQDSIKSFNAHVTAKLNDQAPLTLDLEIPYSEESFVARAHIPSMDMKILNPTVEPLASVRLDDGHIQNFNLTMNATRTASRNLLVLDFEDLSISVIQETEQNEEKKQGVLSGLANVMIRHNNMPGNKNYVKPAYTSQRNIDRGPFNFIWQSIKEGGVLIIPSNTASLLIPSSDKKKKKPKK